MKPNKDYKSAEARIEQMPGGRKKQKCVVFRSAVEATALSSSSDGLNKFHLNESPAVWSLNKIMDIGYQGDDEALISRIVITEAGNEKRTKVQTLQHDD